MIKVIALGGIAGCGKSSLMRRLIKGFSEAKKYKVKLLQYQTHPEEKVVVLGIYSPDEPFPGTDKLSMAVQPETLGVLQHWSCDKTMDGWTVLLEGDRLFNSSFITAVKQLPKVESHWLLLTVNEEEFAKRHENRKQGKTWLAGRKTKLENIVREHPDIVQLENNTEEDQKANKKKILGIIRS